MKKTVLSFGLLSGLIIIIYSTIVFLVFGEFSKMSSSDLQKVEMLGYLRYIILLLTVIFAIRHFKKQNGGGGSFRQLFLAGVYTALIVALLVGIMEMAYLYMNPGFMEQYAEITSKRMMEQGASAEKLEAYKKEMEQYKWMASPVGMGLFYFFETAILGTITSLIVALFARTKKPVSEITSASA